MYLPKGIQVNISEDFITALVIVAELRGQPKCPPTGMAKENMVYIHSGTLFFSVIRKNGVMLFTRN